MIALGNGKISIGGGRPAGVVGNVTSRPSSEAFPHIEYNYTADLADIWWLAGTFHWEMRWSVTIRQKSNSSIWYHKEMYIRQIKATEVIESGINAETNPENDPGDITFTVTTTSSGQDQSQYLIIESLLVEMDIEVAEEDDLMYYVCLGGIVFSRKDAPYDDSPLTQTGTINNIVTGADLDTDEMTDQWTPTSSSGSFRFTDETITRESWVP